VGIVEKGCNKKSPGRWSSLPGNELDLIKKTRLTRQRKRGELAVGSRRGEKCRGRDEDKIKRGKESATNLETGEGHRYLGQNTGTQIDGEAREEAGKTAWMKLRKKQEKARA